jgi:arylsulfatase A-like enzyme/lysophospholipase L1-like esterase
MKNLISRPIASIPMFLILLLFGLAVWQGESCFSAEAASRLANLDRPNVLLIIADDQGYGDIGFHGNTKLETPNLDRLAQQSVRLTNFHVDPTCAETRAALMTGQYSMRGGVWHTVMGRSFLNPQRWIMPQAFKESGYRTGIFGKWHLGDNSPFRPWERGFDESLIHGGGGVGQVPDHWGNDYFDDVYLKNGKPQQQSGYCTNVFADAAAKFMEQDDAQPFFCYLAFNAPHSPYNVPDSFKQKYLNKDVANPMAAFYGMIDCIDSNVGKLLEQLERSGRAKNTIVIYMTDNGTAAGVANNTKPGQWSGYNAEMRGTKGGVYEGGHRVPCFIRFPAQLTGDRDVKELTAHFDLLPTLVSMCGLNSPESWKSDGRDLNPLLRGNKTPWEERAIVVHSQRVDHPEKRRKFVVADQRWRLVGEELYDVQVDPGQAKNVNAEHPDVVERLNAFYDRFWDDVAANVDQYQRIEIGNHAGEEVFLTAHDWHSKDIVAYQANLNSDPAVNGEWAIDVKQAGVYRFRLRLRPDGVAYPMKGVFALVRVGDQEVYQAISADADEAIVEIALPAGPNMIKTVLKRDAAEGEQRGTYFAYVSLKELPNETTATANLNQPDATGIFKANERVALLGATLIERMQMQDELETILMIRTAGKGITFRNVGWSGDDASGRARAVFGGYEEGYQRRLKDLAAAKPNHVLVSYGMNEAFDRGLSLDTFKQQMNRLLDDLSKANYRVTLLSPPEFEAAETDARLSVYKERHPLVSAAINEIAQSRGLSIVAMPKIDAAMTSNSIHLHAAGYSEYSRLLADVLVGTGCRLERDGSEPIVLKVDGTAGEGVVKLADQWEIVAQSGSGDGAWKWKETAQCMPMPLRSTGELMEVGVGPQPFGKVIIDGLADGEFVLEIAEKEVAQGSAGQWAKGIACNVPGLQGKTEQLRRALHHKNELFFHHYRPQNETYLFLFRKHEQGNNAVEIDQFPPLIEPLEKEIQKMSQVSEVVWVLRKK